MQDVFGIQTPMGSILGWSSDRSVLENLFNNDPLMAMNEIVPLKLNDAPLTERGQAIKEDCERIWRERNLLRLRFDKTPAYYAMSMDDRWELVRNLLTIEGEPLDFNDSTREIE